MSSSSTSSSSEADSGFNTWLEEWVIGKLTKKPKLPRRFIDRGREDGHVRLYKDYFDENPVFSDAQFRRRFRMRRHLFLRIVGAIGNHSSYFQQRVDATRRNGLSPLQKCTAAMRMLAYGVAADAVDDYVRIGESTAVECLKNFARCVISVFGEEYLRRPNAMDLQRLLHVGEDRGFPGMMGSIDCMHWEWKNCPRAWKGQYARDHGKATIILEAVASYDLWIWHAFFGVPGSCNDINTLDRSPVFDDILEGRAPPVQFTVNGHQYDMGYYLTDGIYPPWATFIQSIRLPQGAKAKLFAQHQEAARKDVERAFGVLQARFAIVKGPSRLWSMKTMGEILRACIILHNMIVEDERDTYAHYYDISQYDQTASEDENSRWQYSNQRIAAYETYIKNRVHLHNRQIHGQLHHDLVQNIWQRFGT